MKDRGLISNPFVWLGLGALGVVGSVAVIKGLASIPKERLPKRFQGTHQAAQDAEPETAAENHAVASDAKEWVVLYSGHGSAFRYDGNDPNTPPPPPHMTFCAAREAAIKYELHADTIGGRALLENVRTGKRIYEF